MKLRDDHKCDLRAASKIFHCLPHQWHLVLKNLLELTIRTAASEDDQMTPKNDLILKKFLRELFVRGMEFLQATLNNVTNNFHILFTKWWLK